MDTIKLVEEGYEKAVAEWKIISDEEKKDILIGRLQKFFDQAKDQEERLMYGSIIIQIEMSQGEESREIVETINASMMRYFQECIDAYKKNIPME